MAGKVILHHGGGGDNGGHSIDCTATAADILIGKTAIHHDSVDLPGEGTMPNNGDWTSTGLLAGASVSIPLGKHSGNGSVTAAALASQTVGDAIAANILSGKKAWVNGVEVTGTLAYAEW